MSTHLILNDQQVNSSLNNINNNCDYSTIINKNKTKNKNKITSINKIKKSSSKSTKISFLNSALLTAKKNCKKIKKSECKISDNLYSILPSVYLEEHKGMDWRLQQLGYQLPEQDERLLADNTHLSNELKFLRTQQKLCSIQVKLYINNSNINNGINQHNSSITLNEQLLQNLDNNNQVNNNELNLFCNKCEQVINKSSYCVQADLSNLNFFLSTTKTNNQPNNSAGSIQSKSSINNNNNNTPVLKHIYFHIDCLQCITCSEIIVDFRAFGDPRTEDLNSIDKLKIYCSRHFLELFKPRCDLCEELIFDKKCTQAEGRAWHVSHFCCFKCKIPLGGQQYKMANLNQKQNFINDDDKMRLEDLHSNFKNQNQTKEIHPFCLSCCDQLFGEYCARCDQLITCDQNPVKFEKYFWHSTPECFHCDTCGITLVNSDYLPSSSAKQIFCSTKCAQSLQAKDLNNLNNGLMKLNDRLRNNNNLHKPTLNSVQEEDYNALELDQVDNNKILLLNNKVEYENSSMFHLASNKNTKLNNNELLIKNKEDLKSDDNNQKSPSSNRSSNRSLSSLSLLFSSSPNSDQNESNNISNSNNQNSKEQQQKCEKIQNKEEKSIDKKQIENCSSSSIESVSSTETNQLNQLNPSTSTITKEIIINDSIENASNNKIVFVEKQTNNNEEASLNHQRLVPYVIVNNNPFTRTSIIIDNLNTTLTTMQILENDEFVNCNFNNSSNSSSSSMKSNSNDANLKANNSSSINNSTISSDSSLENKSSNESNSLSNSELILNNTSTSTLTNTNNNNINNNTNDNTSNLNTKSNQTTMNLSNSNNLVLKENNKINQNILLNGNKESIQNFNYNLPYSIHQQQQQIPTHYSTLPTRKTQRKPFKYEEPTNSQLNNYSSNNNFNTQNVQSIQSVHQSNNTLFSIKNCSSQSIIDSFGRKPVNSMNEVGLPIVNNKNFNMSSFVTCTLPRNTRNTNANHQSSTENGYLNGAQSISISKLNATMLQSNFNRLSTKYLQQQSNNNNNSSFNNSPINTSTNSDFSTTSSSKNSLIRNQNLNSHSVVVSEDQLIESLNTKLIVKPLTNNKDKINNNNSLNVISSRIQPPLPPVEHGFIKKWSTTSISSNSSTISNQLKDLPVIKEHHLILNNSNNDNNQNNNQTSSERTSSTTPSLSSSIEIQSNDLNEHPNHHHSNQSNTNLITIQNFSSSNNSLNTINQIITNLNSSNSASLISATSSINSTISSSNETTQLSSSTRITTPNLIHNRPDVISHLNPIETMKQLKQKQRELKLKEKNAYKSRTATTID